MKAWSFGLLVCLFTGLLLCSLPVGAEEETVQVDFSRVLSVFTKHCNACHNSEDADADLVLDSHASILKGGENGAVVVPGDSAKSLLIRLIERREKPFMPPGKREAPSSEEIALVRAWIDAGARAGTSPVREIQRPPAPPRGCPRSTLARRSRAGTL